MLETELQPLDTASRAAASQGLTARLAASVLGQSPI